MARKLKSDRVLFLTTMGLVAASVVMVYSASNVLAMQTYGQPNLFLVKQVMFSVIGIAVMFLAMAVDYRVYRDPRVIWTVVGCTLLALVAVLVIGPKINGTRRWFALGGVGIQPSELAKIAAILFTAAVLERRMDRINDLKYSLAPIALLLAVMLGLILKEPDYGTAVAILAIVGVMVFAAGLAYSYVGALAITLVPIAGIIAWLPPYRVRRLMAFMNPWDDPLDAGFQAVQSMIAVGTGGVTGRGLGYSVQKLFYLPYPHTDFIYAVVAEELGLIGATLILVCFCVITWRGLRIVSRAPDAFGSFVALGLTAMIAVQAFFNMSMVLGLLPTKGITLPFVSAGGSSLIVSLAGMGVLLNISQRASAVAE